MPERVVVTGMGVVSPIGVGTAAFSDALIQGRSGVRRITRFDASPFKSQIAGEIREADLKPALDTMDPKSLHRMDRFARLAVIAAAEALHDSGLASRPADEGEIGVVIGTGLGGIGTTDIEHMRIYTKGPRAVSPLAIPLAMHSAAASHIAIQFALRGPNLTISTGCAAGAHAIGHAYLMIKHGCAKALVAGGADAPITPSILAAWSALRVLSARNNTPETACRPFSRDRDGLVLGEGAGILVLESLAHAVKRSAPLYGEVAGFAANGDASHLTQPSPRAIATVIRRALQDAGQAPEGVEYISAHGTATALNDRVETEAIRQVFGERAHAIPVSSLKSMMGHAMGASGALQAIAAFLSMRARLIPPTINYTEQDPACDLDYVPNRARPGAVNLTMVNAFAFGGNNAILVLKKGAER